MISGVRGTKSCCVKKKLALWCECVLAFLLLSYPNLRLAVDPFSGGVVNKGKAVMGAGTIRRSNVPFVRDPVTGAIQSGRFKPG